MGVKHDDLDLFCLGPTTVRIELAKDLSLAFLAARPRNTVGECLWV